MLEVRTDARRFSKGQRRAKAPKLPTAIELIFVQATRALVARYAKAVLPLALAAAKKFGKQPTTERTDAKKITPQESRAKAVTSHMRAVARRALARGLPAFEARSKVAADRAQGHSQKELEKLGIKPKKEPELKWLVDGWRKDNVAKIKGLADHQLDRIEKILAAGENRDPESIAADIREQLEGISDRQAERIARTQVLKLNAQINEHRQQAAGVESYIWTTQNDDRVRDAHAELDGTEFDWDSGGDPEEGHPGEAPNCRCIAFPIPPPNEDDTIAEDVEDKD